MDDTPAVGMLQRVSEIDAVLDGRLHRKESGRDARREGDALHVLHCDEGWMFVCGNLVNRTDQRMIEGGGECRLSAKSQQCGGIFGQIVAEELERNRAT